MKNQSYSDSSSFEYTNCFDKKPIEILLTDNVQIDVWISCRVDLYYDYEGPVEGRRGGHPDTWTPNEPARVFEKSMEIDDEDYLEIIMRDEDGRELLLFSMDGGDSTGKKNALYHFNIGGGKGRTLLDYIKDEIKHSELEDWEERIANEAA